MIEASDPLTRLNELNSSAPAFGEVTFERRIPFGARLEISCYRLTNGLKLLLVPDASAPVIAFHAWFRVGSRHEKPGKTGLAHLFEHLMFNEVEGLEAGEFDKKLEAVGADNNASTWLDFTQYQEAFPKQHLELVLGLEAKRMNQLVLREPQVMSEKEVVKNERRYRVEDDVEGTVEELLWKTAFEKHSYQWPTIGWMKDIEGFTTEDCRAFYEAYYAPNNASIILVGDFEEIAALSMLRDAYGHFAPSVLPAESDVVEPVQSQERVVEIEQPTPTEKIAIGYKGPAMSDPDHIPLTLLMEVLVGGRASRIRRRLVRTDQIASDASGCVGPHSHPSLIEFQVSAREDTTSEELLRVVDEEIARVKTHGVEADELVRACARLEFGLLSGLESADGKASTIGFYQTVLGEPAGAMGRLEAMKRTSLKELQVAAQKYLNPESRTVIKVRAQELA